ncbi:MAG: phosphoribosyltransferase family protein [Vicinamibacterales bacterium]
MRFSNRDEAARLLAERLAAYKGRRPLVLGVPRGAVPMAATIAEALDGDLDVVLVRKLRAPGQPELAVGAVDDSGAIVKGAYYDLVPPEALRQEIALQRETLRARRARYAAVRSPVPAAGRVVIIVDDGIATGASMEAAIHALRARRPTALVVAVGVAPPHTLARLRPLVDELVCLHATEDFAAVGEFYDHFADVSDAEVEAALAGTPAPAGPHGGGTAGEGAAS